MSAISTKQPATALKPTLNPATNPKPNHPKPPIIREYEIKGLKYIVSATTKNGAKEDAAAIIRRPLRKEIGRVANI